VVLAVAIGLLGTHAIFADEVQEADEVQNASEVQACLKGQLPRVLSGLRLAPVRLNFRRTNILLAGLGSYIVNAQGGCNDCHTSPPYARGGDPFQGEPERINAAGYMAGGMDFGPFVSRNITACANGRPAGLTFAQFVRVMRTGVDLKDGRTGPPNTPILQVMPWPVYGNMSRCDLLAIYEFLKAIPPHDNQGCTPGGP
jgi:hypothetical protein